MTSAAGLTTAIFSEMDASLLTHVYSPDSQFRFVRVTSGGTILDAEPRLLTDDAQSGSVRAAAIGTDVLAVWRSFPSGDGTLQAAILHGGDGSVERLRLPRVDRFSGLDVATNGRTWLVAAGPFLIAVSRTGLVLNPAPVRFVADRLPQSVSLASDGDRFLLAWEDDADARQQGSGPARIALVDGDGSLLFTGRIVAPAAYAVSAAFTGREYLVASTDLASTRITPVAVDGAAGAAVVLRSQVHPRDWSRSAPARFSPSAAARRWTPSA